MDFKNDMGGMPAGSSHNDSDADGRAEINLYDQLLAFSALTPEQQTADLERIEAASNSALLPQSAAPPPAQKPARVVAPATESVRATNSGLDSNEVIRFTGSLGPRPALADDTLETCFSCDSEVGSKDIICVACACFLDNAEFQLESDMLKSSSGDQEESSQYSHITCGDCGQGASPGDLFCAACGSVLH